MPTEKEKDEAVRLLEEQLETERQLVDLYEETSEYIIDERARHLLRSLKLDSSKHVDILQVVIDLLRGKKVTSDDRIELKVGVEHHMKLERDSIERAQKLKANPWIRDSEGLSRLVRRWEEDERAHHGLLKDLVTDKFTLQRLFDAFTNYRETTRRKLRRELLNSSP